MNNNTRQTINVLFYLVAFVLIQIVVQGAAFLIAPKTAATGTSLALISIVSSALTIALFLWRRWSPFSRKYMQSRPWDVFAWTALLSLGSIAPMMLLLEFSGMDMPDELTQALVAMMSSEWGYAAVAILAPVAEEMVFRGAILRTLLTMCGSGRHWWAIVVSAMVFGAVHFNMVQFVNATLLGLLLGWLYFRTGSIAPGILFHFVNNSVSFGLFRLMPSSVDMKLTEFFNGDYVRLGLFIFCSLCVFVPSLLQLKSRMRRA